MRTKQDTASPEDKSGTEKVRIDRWLWAARFFKTRNLAKQALEGGKVQVDGHKVKAGKDVGLGMTLRIRQGWDDKEVLITGISDQRRGAPEAAKLYQETAESIEKRKTHAEQRKALGPASMRTPTKPNTKQRRQMHRIKREILDN